MHEDWSMPLPNVENQNTGTSTEQRLDDENDRLLTNNLELCSALKAVYALAGEDPQIEKIVNDAINQHGE